MTTPAAAQLYMAEHSAIWEGKGYAAYNPNGRSIDDLPMIYGFNNGGSDDWWVGLLMAEDGTCLGEHVCSHENYMPHDLGILEGSRPDRHETFRNHYPDGYKMTFVRAEDVRDHYGLMQAYEKNQKMGEDDD